MSERPAADQATADLVAFVQSIDPAEAVTQIEHVAAYLDQLADRAPKDIESTAYWQLVGVCAGVIGGLVEQINTKPGGLKGASVPDEESVIRQIGRGLRRILHARGLA